MRSFMTYDWLHHFVGRYLPPKVHTPLAMLRFHSKVSSTSNSGLPNEMVQFGKATNRLVGRARLLPSQRRIGSAGASPSQRKCKNSDWTMSTCRGALLAGSIGLCLLCGCSTDFNSGLGLEQSSAPITELIPKVVADAQVPEESDSADVPAGKLIAKSELPSPGRTNAFELSGEFQTESVTQETGAKREVHIIGFVEVDTPRVMLSIDGRTETLKVNDTIDRITVLEIAPPRAKLSSDGVSWNASIFDKRNANGDGAARRKN